ncbi:MAG: RICIN domain-containing protein [Janthinobacterium lividum]
MNRGTRSSWSKLIVGATSTVKAKGRKTLVPLAVLTLAATGIGFSASSASADAGTTPLRSWNNGRCLDSNGAGTAYALGCNGGSYQNWLERTPALPEGVGWTYEHPGTPFGAQAAYGPWKLVDQATGRCLDSNVVGSVYTNPCWINDENQFWTDVVWHDNVHTLVNWQTGRALQIGSGGGVTAQPIDYNNHSVLLDVKRGY